jgi:hypothetical protein
MAQNIVLEPDDPRRILAVWPLYHHRPLMKLLLNRDLVSALLNHSRLQTVPTMSHMNRMQQLTIINIMLKYFLDQANNMPNMKMRVNFAKHNNLNTGVASDTAQG